MLFAQIVKEHSEKQNQNITEVKKIIKNIFVRLNVVKNIKKETQIISI